MLKDIPRYDVEEIAIAIVPEDTQNTNLWMVYLLNLKNERIDNVLISSKGYGMLEGNEVKTSVLRHFIDSIANSSYVKVEPIPESLFGLSNEYWVSFYIQGIIYDKKYVFLPESIIESNFTTIPLINKKGVMIK